MDGNIVAFAGDDELYGAQDEVDLLLHFLEAVEFDDKWNTSAREELLAKMRKCQKGDPAVWEEHVELLRQLPCQFVS